MLDIFSGLRLVVKRRNISIDNAIFRCHWFFTSTLLVSFSLVITARQYVGQPIECHSIDKIPDSLLNSYCWVQSTFSVPRACDQQVGVEAPYPCIDNRRGREVRVFAYYQWVGMVLFIQGLLFHLPYYLWKVWENGLIKAITGGLRVAVLSDQERAKKKDIVVEYIHDHLGGHKRYALKYFICESICLVNLLAQLWATNKFFDGQFLRYGIDVLQYSSSSLSSQSDSVDSQTSSSTTISNSSSSSSTLPAHITKQQPSPQRRMVDPMTYIFPRMTKCTYYDFGSSGDVQKHDALCLLPLNIINEKIYIALWFWFIILALLTLIVIVGRLCAIFSERVRCMGLVSRCRLSRKSDIHLICHYCDVGDWFLFYMVAENLDPLIMREIVHDIATKIEHQLKLKSKPGEGLPLDLCFDEKLPSKSGFRRASSVSYEESPLVSSSPRSFMGDDVPLIDTARTRSTYKRKLSSSLSDLRSQVIDQPTQVANNSDMRPLQQRPVVQSARTAGQPIAYETLYEDEITTNSGQVCYRRASVSFEESPILRTGRRNSNVDDGLVASCRRQFKKRFYKRNRTYDLSELRQRLFEQQPPFNPHYGYHRPMVVTEEPFASQIPYNSEATINSFGFVSAPPASLMPLGSAANSRFMHRRGSLTRMSSNSSASSTTDSVIVDMETTAS